MCCTVYIIHSIISIWSDFEFIILKNKYRNRNSDIHSSLKAKEVMTHVTGKGLLEKIKELAFLYYMLLTSISVNDASLECFIGKQISQISYKLFSIMQGEDGEKLNLNLSVPQYLLTKAWGNSSEHDMSSPISTASPSYMLRPLCFMQNKKQIHYLTGCALNLL